MSVLAQFQFANLTGLTTVTVSGTVTLATSPSSVVFDVTGGGGSGGFNKNGVYQTTGRGFYPGHVIYGQVNTASIANDFFFLATSASGVGFGGMVAARILSNAGGAGIPGIVGYDDNTGDFGTPFIVVPGTWYDIKYRYVNGGASDTTIEVSARLSDNPGNLDPDSSAWTLIGNSATTYTPGTFHLAAQQRDVAAQSPVTMADWIWTDNGSITSSTIFSSDMNTSAGWTNASSGGSSVTFGASAGITQINNSGSTSTGTFHSTLAYALDAGQVITFTGRITGSFEEIAWLSTDFTASSSAGIGFYWHSNNIVILTGTADNSLPVAGGDNVDLKIVCNSNGTVNCYAKQHADPNYTLIGHYANSIGQRLYATYFGGLTSSSFFIGAVSWDDGLDAPPVPTSLVATPASNTEIDLTYSDNGTSGNETGVKVERSLVGSGVGFSQIATVAQGVGAYSNTSLTAGTKYYYRVRSYITIAGIDYNSAYSSEASATTTGGGTGTSTSANMLALEEL